ncbi:MAG: ABC transporter permease subunit [Candidatus Micrarchaeia archaeon]
MGGKENPLELVFYLVCVAFFLLLVFLPTLYLIFRSCPNGSSLCLPNVYVTKEMQDALFNSFSIAFLVVVVDVVFGVPVAWILARYKLRSKKYLNFLIDMPLIVPTAALGFSVAVFWGGEGIGLLSKGYWMIFMVHAAFTYPYIVRTLTAAIEEIDINYEIAARTLGAPPLTAFRTVTLPLFKAGLFIGGMLAFTRSLSETGATMMAVGVGEFFAATAPVQTLLYKNSGDMTSAVSLSLILIATSTILLAVVRNLAYRFRIPIGKPNTSFEASLGRLSVYKNILSLLFLFLLVLLPSFFFLKHISPSFHHFDDIIQSILISFLIAITATAVDLLFGVGMAILIGKNKYGLGELFDFLIDAVMVMPTVALGLSLGMFWGAFNINEFVTLAMVHLALAYPYIVKPISASIRAMDKELEQAARTLGADQFKVFRTITLPLIMPSITAGAIMAFMRSLSETGATLAVSKTFKTIPVLIVDFVKTNQFPEAAFASGVLLLISFFAAFLLRRK